MGSWPTRTLFVVRPDVELAVGGHGLAGLEGKVVGIGEEFLAGGAIGVVEGGDVGHDQVDGTDTFEAVGRQQAEPSGIAVTLEIVGGHNGLVRGDDFEVAVAESGTVHGQLKAPSGNPPTRYKIQG